MEEGGHGLPILGYKDYWLRLPNGDMILCQGVAIEPIEIGTLVKGSQIEEFNKKYFEPYKETPIRHCKKCGNRLKPKEKNNRYKGKYYCTSCLNIVTKNCQNITMRM